MGLGTWKRWRVSGELVERSVERKVSGEICGEISGEEG